MVTKTIVIPSNDNKVYRQVLAVLRFISNLSDQENDTLSQLIKLNYEYLALPEDRRAKFLLSTEMRKEMRTAANIEEKQFNGLIARLKKKSFMGAPILSEEGVLNPNLFFKPDDEGFKIEVIFKFVADDKQKSSAVLVPTVEQEPVQETVPTVSEEIQPGRPEGYVDEDNDFQIELTPPV